MSFQGEFGATDSVRSAVENQMQSQSKWTIFNRLLSLKNYGAARKFAEENSNIKAFTTILSELEEEAGRQINRP